MFMLSYQFTGAVLECQHIDQLTANAYVLTDSTGLTDKDVIMNSMIFMVAGYDTTATTLGWIIYELALNPEVQQTLRQEIDSEIGQVSLYILTIFDYYLNRDVRKPVFRISDEA